MGREYKEVIFKEPNTNAQQTWVKMLRIISYQGRENEIYLRFHLIPVRMTISQKSKSNNAGEQTGKMYPNMLLVGI